MTWSLTVVFQPIPAFLTAYFPFALLTNKLLGENQTSILNGKNLATKSNE